MTKKIKKKEKKEVCAAEMDLDALLGPKQQKPGSVIVTTIGRNCCPTDNDKEEKEKKKEEEEKKRPRSGARKQGLITASVSVRKETDEEKHARQAARRQILEEEEKRKRAKLSETELQKERELLEATEFMEKLYSEKKAREAAERQRLQDHILLRDGSEKPLTFSIEEEERLRMMGVDEERAVALDKAIPVTDYYAQGLYPVSSLVMFVTQYNRVPLSYCELAFVVNGSWWRKKRFDTADQLRRFIVDTKPERIEVGPVHVSPDGSLDIPHSKLPRERYLAFDVDMEDRDISKGKPDEYIRGCSCKGTKSVCSSGCWFYMRVAVLCLTYLLRQCFGSEFILPVYSGRRGIHVYALDRTFLKYTKEDRTGIVDRIKLYGRPREYSHPEHTVYLYEYILKPEFYKNFLDGNTLINDPETTRVILQRTGGPTRMPPDAVSLLTDLGQARTRDERVATWTTFCALVGQDFEMDFIFYVMYPRLDAGVTTNMDHCVKAPFVVHPGTKQCSVPIPDIDTWLPHMAPRLSELGVALPFETRGYHPAPGKPVLSSYIKHLEHMVLQAYPMRGPAK